MTPSKLKALYEASNPNGHFFTRDTMKYFGDTMANYRVIEDWIEEVEGSGVSMPVYVLERKRPVKFGVNGIHIFDEDGNLRPDLKDRI